MKEEDEIIVIGDVHSLRNLRDMVSKICHNMYRVMIICVGDCGFGIVSEEVEKHFVENILTLLRRSNNVLYICRGNHDDPSYFKSKQYSNSFILMKDYGTAILRNGKKVLFVGGAVSIDRFDRIATQKGTKTWWADELFVYKKFEYMNIDIVITHSAPNFCEPVGFSSIVEHYIKKEKDQGLDYLRDQILQEREDLAQLYQDISENNKISYWFYGHYHKNLYAEISGTKFICVNQEDYYVIPKRDRENS